ncbi:MAG TPA: NAD(P)/FAD-dependent oxidoreductase [Terriglobales bacterium]|nr:NAD(P)/FAD-dependent oxidoreductase [Terriglobales bacterium]
MKRDSVVILGGGVAGLTTAYFLGRAGYRPLVLEASDQLGGLGASFQHDGVTIDRFYHVLLDTDSELLGLVDELGLAEHLVWQATGMGFYLGGRLYGMNSPLDLLRFAALPVGDRLRTAWGAVRATRLQRDPLQLDDVTAREWLHRLFGERVAARIWEPLLRAKFGDAAPTIPAYWVWSLLNREKNGGKEVKGYLRGGFQVLADRLCQAIRANGGEVRLNHPVSRLDRDGDDMVLLSQGEVVRANLALSTLPVALLRRIASPAIAADLPRADLRYQGVVNAVVVGKKPLEQYYWTIVVDPRFAFQGVVETTHVIPPQWLGDRHLVYLMNYCDAGSETYGRSDETLRAQALDGLSQLYPRFRREDVEAVYVFRAPHVEPVWSLGYTRKRPGYRVGNSNLYLTTTAQAYPRVTAWNTSIALAREAVATMLAQHGQPSAEASEPMRPNLPSSADFPRAAASV